MGLFDRIWRVIRANITSLVSNAEDPEKVLEQTMLEMQENLIQLRQAVAQAIATQKRTERQCQQALSLAQDWYNRAQMALQQGDETLAREALTKRKSYQETAQAMQTQIDQQNSVVNQLKRDMRSLEGKIAEAKSKKDLYIARARSAQASLRLNEMLDGFNPNSSLSAFEKMEDKVMELEAQSQAIASLNEDTLEKEFISLQGANDIDQELLNLKSQVSSSTKNPPLPASDESP